MSFQAVESSQRDEFNRIVTHPLQSYEWGEFREKTGVKVIRRGLFQSDKLVDAFQLTIHSIPNTPFSIGYLPKGSMPTKELIEELQLIGKQEKCIFIQMEPNVVRRIYKNEKGKLADVPNEVIKFSNSDAKTLHLSSSAHPLFTKFTFVLDLNKTEEELLSNMHSKTRYNIRVAQKRGVIINEKGDMEAFEEYLRLTRETTTRQKFYAHTEKYHKTQWNILHGEKTPDRLVSSLLLGKIEEQTVVAWILFMFKDVLYYPYGASSSLHREAMASNLVMYEAIMLGKKRGLKEFDMWGALGPFPDPKDSWHGFHRFKLGYGADLVEMIGSYDLVINPVLYKGYKVMDKLRWTYLRLRK